MAQKKAGGSSRGSLVRASRTGSTGEGTTVAAGRVPRVASVASELAITAAGPRAATRRSIRAEPGVR